MKRRSRAQTLVEMLVVCGMVTLATFTILGLWEVGGRMFTRSDGQSVSQRAVIKFINLFTRETVVAPSASLTTCYRSNTPVNQDLAVAFLSDQDSSGNVQVDPSSYNPIYQAWMVYFVDLPTHTLQRLRLPLAPPSLSLAVLQPGDIALDISAGGATVVLSNVVSWQALDYDTGVAINSTQNPARYSLMVNSLDFALEFRNHLLR